MLDLDNTLGDRAAAVEDWLGEFAAEHHLDDATRHWIASLDEDGYAPRAEVFELIRQRLSLSEPVEELLASYRARVVELTRPTTDAHSCLVALRSGGHRLAIVTNGSSGQQHAKIERLGLAPLVDAVVVSDDVGLRKPDPHIFELAAHRAGVTLDGAWMVGDSPTHDIAAATALGLRTIWIRRGRRWSIEDGPAPTHIVDSPADIPNSLFANS